MQPTSGYQWSYISATAAATATLFTGETRLIRIVVPANATGTVTFYDSASGTNSSNLGAYPCTTGTIPTSIEFGAALRTGLTYTSGGTSGMLVIYG